MPQVKRVAVILAGGSGERFWPLSTPDRPKQLLKLADASRTLLEEAVDRAEPLFTRDHIYVVTGDRIGPAIVNSGLLNPGHVLIEPVAKNTLGALCWAVSQLRLKGYSDDTTMAVLTADHAIGNPEKFRETVTAAMQLAESAEGLVTIGVSPTRPETGYGYIQQGEPAAPGFRVHRFAEKPDEATAQAYVDSGEYLWNSGMFFWKVGAFTRELERHAPDALAVLDLLQDDPSAFHNLQSIAVDRAVMERSDRIYVIPAGFPWDDVGAWDSLQRTNAADANGNVIIGDGVEIDSSGTTVFAEGITVGVVGVKDLIVVATPNGMLVCHRTQAQRVRELVAKLKSGRSS
jgi:mannose-1-phosphate guanylyltransferase